MQKSIQLKVVQPKVLFIKSSANF